MVKKNSVVEPVETTTQIDAPYELPEGWKWARLVDVCETLTGSTPSKKRPEFYGGDFPFFKPADLDQGMQLFEASEYLSEHGKKCSRFIPAHSTLICCIGSIGKSGYSLRDGTSNQQINAAIPRSIINPKFLFYAVNSENFKNQLWKNSSSTTISIINKSKMDNCILPLPPLSEQQRIISRIESMFAKLDEAKEKAQNVVDSFEARKAAILHQAFTGNLTAKWRKENIPEKSSQYLEAIKDKVKIRLDFKYWENPKLPDSWCESTIGNLLYFAGRVGWKGLKAEEYTQEGPILLSVYNLNEGDEVTYNRINHISMERYEESPEIMVREHDILLTKDGAGIGKLGYINELPEKATINSSLLLIRPGKVANYKYIYYLLSGPALQNLVKERITGSATPHLFQRDIKEFILPIPSLSEQQEIVRILDTVLEKEHIAKSAAEQVLEQIDLLKKSILARAFRGEL